MIILTYVLASIGALAVLLISWSLLELLILSKPEPFNPNSYAENLMKAETEKANSLRTGDTVQTEVEGEILVGYMTNLLRSKETYFIQVQVPSKNNEQYWFNLRYVNKADRVDPC